MGRNLAPTPPWAERALQGLVFWIGHRRALYRHHPLSEGALVAETCNLIYANLDKDKRLLCERQYRDLLPAGHSLEAVGARSRADIVVVRKPTQKQADGTGSLVNNLEAVIEVKRASTSGAQIDNDLRRLAEVKVAVQQVRAFLFVVSEAKQPLRRFVSPDGRAILGATEIHETPATYRVRRVCKASASFNGRKTAHYACIIEVEPNRVSQLQRRK